MSLAGCSKGSLLHCFSDFHFTSSSRGWHQHCEWSHASAFFHSKSHGNWELQIQPYLHPDIHFWRDFFSLLWSDPENTGGVMAAPPSVSVQALCCTLWLQTSCCVVQVSFAGKTPVPPPACEMFSVAFLWFIPQVWIIVFIICWPSNTKVCWSHKPPSLPVHRCSPILLKYGGRWRDSFSSMQVPSPGQKHFACPIGTLIPSLWVTGEGKLGPYPCIPWHK